MRHYFSGGYRRYVYDGDRMLEVTNDAGNDVRARYTTWTPGAASSARPARP